MSAEATCCALGECGAGRGGAGSVSERLPVSSAPGSAPALVTAPPPSFELKPLPFPSSKYVKLNVGGSLHYTTVQTLSKQDSLLKEMFSGSVEVLTDSEGWVLIDRSGKHFGTVLNFLRDGAVPLPDAPRELQEVQAEARHYRVPGLQEACHTALQQKSAGADAVCRIPMITSPKEEQKLISSCSQPVVKLQHNRSNNKYSYTSNSDDNLLKNIELFDKLGLRFNGRVLFIKDVLGDEICCWSFYGEGRKIAEVCCTSIVYATEKKQTKVEFPEARIFEETLNILIYEGGRGGGVSSAVLEAGGVASALGLLPPEEEDERGGREKRVRRIHVRRHIMHDERPHGQQAVFKD
ncbi:BTB/POZ domain-containing adapter for CUL3-mediated RhoA degradation protein 1 [Acipenser ruthenus]|nr:BTB/POZ domain-containing adapter for CUL3-mediated RhoA degradation protein 1 [Acipenser ruthenus]